MSRGSFGHPACIAHIVQILAQLCNSAQAGAADVPSSIALTLASEVDCNRHETACSVPWAVLAGQSSTLCLTGSIMNSAKTELWCPQLELQNSSQHCLRVN